MANPPVASAPMDGESHSPTPEAPAASPARVEAAEVLRRLGHAIVGHENHDEVFERIAGFVREILPEVESGPVRHRPIADMKRRLLEGPPADGEAMHHFPECVVSGVANPMGIAIDCHREGSEAVARITLGAAFEGAPQRAHGGIVAAIFDDVMGFVPSIEGAPAYTARLCIDYLAPTPVGEPLEFRARMRERDGRKLWIDAEATGPEGTVARAEGLFIAIPRDRLGLSDDEHREVSQNWSS